MRIKFYLKRPVPGPGAKPETIARYKANPSASTAIYALVNYSGHSLKVYTNESINPQYWNQKANCVKTTPRFPEGPEFNQRLAGIRSTINKAYLDYRNINSHAVPPPAEFKRILDNIFSKGGQAITFLSFFEDFVNRTLSGQRIDPRSKKPIGYGVAKGYKTTLNHLKNFAKQWHRALDFQTVDLEFHADYTKYLTVDPVGSDKKPLLLSANTVGMNFQRIKAVMNEAVEKGLTKNEAFKGKYFIKQSEDADTIYLTEQELKAIRDFDFSENPRLDNARDLFLIGCYTGLRFSDFSILKPENISDGYISIRQTKTGNPVVIPVHRIVKEILAKYNGSPRSISNVKLNLYLKEIGERIDCLKVTVSKTQTRGGSKFTKNYKKFELLTTHTARRSFATNEYHAGTPLLVIMAITGHKTEKAVMKYLRITPDDHARAMKQLWADRDLKNNLKAI